MACPLYKKLKTNGTSFYAFPGAAEDISAAYNNQNYKMYFSKYVLLNFPKQNLTAGTASNPVAFDFDSSFYRLTSVGQQALTYQDQLVESLRNYVANHESTIRESKLNNTEYYYDSNALETTTEKIFWKWCKKLNLIDFDPAIDGDEYFGNLVEFERGNLNDDTYFPEILWKERSIKDYRTIKFYQSGVVGYTNNLEIEFESITNYRVGDKITFLSISDSNISYLNGVNANILYMIDADISNGQRAILDITYSASLINEQDGISNLVYHKLVQYIGEVNGINNVQFANRSYTEVYAHIPDHTGQTPDILFRTMADVNYKPGLFYPILPSQYQPEIVGAELFNSPIVSNPQSYPGNYYAQFDSEFEYTYQTADGDTIRRSGDYFGVQGDINSPVLNGSTLDGITVDFNTSHYVKMNIIDRELTNFDQFNALEVNNQPPKDFEFNSILWYYTVEDNNGNKFTNLYGISILDNPDNNPIESEVGIRIPTYKKLAANDLQDGVSYAFSLNLNYNIINDNPQDSYNPEAINSLFGFNLFNAAMKKLSSIGDSFMNIIAEQNILKNDLLNTKQLIYTQTDFSNINRKIQNLEELLNLYQYNQMVSSDTVQVETFTNLNSYPVVRLNSIDPQYYKVENIKSTDLYNESGIVPLSISVPKNKNFLIRVINNDQTIFNLPNNDKLTIYLDRDLDFRQSVDIFVDSYDFATQNKKLDFYINYSNGVGQLPVLTKSVDTIDMPIYYNSYLQLANSSKTWNKFSFEVDMSSNIDLYLNGILYIPMYNVTSQILSNSVKKGDTLVLNDFIVGTSSYINFSGQYIVDEIDSVTIRLNVSTNITIATYAESNITNGTYVTLNSSLANKPYFSLNKGIGYKLTRIDRSATASFTDRYMVEKIS